MITSRCKHFGVHETVPRHECSAAQCEFEDAQKIKDEVDTWIYFETGRGMLPGTLSDDADRKLEYAEKLAKRLDRTSGT